MNLLVRVFGCEMAVNSTRVVQPQRMTSLLVEEGFSGGQSHMSRLLYRTLNRKSYPIYRMVPLSMTLSDLWPGFQGHSIFEVDYLKTKLLLNTNRKSLMADVSSNDLGWPWKAGCEESIFFRRILITLGRSATSLHLCIYTNASHGFPATVEFLVYFVTST